MVGTRRVGLLLAISLVSLCKADDENFGKNNAGIATQTVVQDSKGGEIRVVTTIRDTSWPSSIVYSPMSYYEVLPQFYKDKISVREVTLGKLDYFFSLFCSAIPRQWHPASDKVTVWHLDLFDAMTLAVQDANVKIVQAALTQIPYSKSILSSGKSTDFINNQAVTVNGKFKIDQFIELACDSMATRVNKQRVIKFAAAGFVGAVGSSATLASLAETYFIDLPTNFFMRARAIITGGFNETTKDVLTASAFAPDNWSTKTSWQNGLLMASGTVTAILAHRLQHIYVDGYIKVLDMLISADGVTFDHKVAYEKIKALKDKVQWFGLSNKDVERLQLVLNKL